LAAETRESLRLAPTAPIPHLTRALERAGIAVAPLVLPDVEGEENVPVRHFGVSHWAGIGAAALVGYFPGQQGDRDRFTLAHEVGHLALHTFRPRTQQAVAEDEANRFATALLVPVERATAMMSEALTLSDYARLKATWGVSIQALIMRAHTVGAIGDTRKNSLHVQLSAKGWRKQEPVAVGHEAPKLLWTLLSRRYGSRPYLPGSEDLAIHPTLLRSIAPTETPAAAARPSPAATAEPALRFTTSGVADDLLGRTVRVPLIGVTGRSGWVCRQSCTPACTASSSSLFGKSSGPFGTSRPRSAAA
jgi:Zn-dependent peptidase ImmA (M78 family)